jgi:phage terminase large subunit-like protein
MKRLETSLDWNVIEAEIKGLENTLPLFKHDIKRFLKAIREDITALSKLEVELRRTHSKQLERECASKVTKINDTLKLFQKFHLMALLGQ